MARTWGFRRLALAGATALLASSASIGWAQDFAELTGEELAPLGVVDPALFAAGGACSSGEDVTSLSTEGLESLAGGCCSSGSDQVFDVVATAQAVLGPEQAAAFTAACLAAIATAAGPIAAVAVTGPDDNENRLGIENDRSTATLGGPSATSF